MAFENPFQQIDLRFPKEYQESLQGYVQGKNKDRAPFPRMVDMWFLAVCLAVKEGLKPIEGISNPYKIIEGSIFAQDPWRIGTLQLIAIEQTDDPDIVSEPRKVMEIATGLAIAGMPKVLELLEDGHEPIWGLSDGLEKLLSEEVEQTS